MTASHNPGGPDADWGIKVATGKLVSGSLSLSFPQ